MQMKTIKIRTTVITIIIKIIIKMTKIWITIFLHIDLAQYAQMESKFSQWSLAQKLKGMIYN